MNVLSSIIEVSIFYLIVFFLVYKPLDIVQIEKLDCSPFFPLFLQGFLTLEVARTVALINHVIFIKSSNYTVGYYMYRALQRSRKVTGFEGILDLLYIYYVLSVQALSQSEAGCMSTI